MRILLGMVALCALAVGGGGIASGDARAEPAAQERLVLTGELTYDVRPGQGPVAVTWHVQLLNNDPATVYRDFGFISFYGGVTLPILKGATSLRANGPGGVALGASVEDFGESALAVANVVFDRNLFYGDRYDFTLTYELAPAQSDFLLVSPHYVYLPAISLGQSSVRLITPSGDDWDVIIEDDQECEPTAAAEYACSGTYEATQLAAFVEVSQPGALESRRMEVELAERTLDLTIRYFPDQEDWAQRVGTVASEALPVLESLFGFPYDGPDALEIAQRGRRDVFGYEGVFSCTSEMCSIGVSPRSQLAGDHVLLHELAHAWTEPFADRWLAEGFAEYMAQRAEERLAEIVTPLEQPLFERTVEFQLESWGPGPVFLNATDEQREREFSGYAASVEFLEELQRTVGLKGLQAATGASEKRVRVDSRRFLDLLEDATGERLDVLFRDRVFLPNSVALLEERRAARDRLDELRRAVEAAGLELPPRIGNLNDSWLFEQANDVMVDAEEALQRLTDGRDQVERSRSYWQRIGLIGADPEADIHEAVVAFGRGNYQESNERAEAATNTIDGANRKALIRVVAAIGAAVVIGSLLGGVSVLAARLRRGRAA